ncbi:hypothetical protein Tco_0610694 [Tanacetum coccineum]
MNVVPLRSDTVRLVQNGCAFLGLWSEDLNQHLKDFLKLVNSLDLSVENRERTRLRLFQFSLLGQASNWLERLPAGSISTWEDLTTCFLAIKNDKGKEGDEIVDKNIVKPIKLVEKKEAMDDVQDNESDISMNEDSTRWGKYVDGLMEMPRSQPLEYYLKHETNKKTIEGLIDNHKYNDSLLATHLGKLDNVTYKMLPVGPMYDAILKKKLAMKDGRGGNFVITCSIGRLKFISALADQGSDVNIMPLSIYNKLTSEKPVIFAEIFPEYENAKPVSKYGAIGEV